MNVCAACGLESPDAARFCMGCGASFAAEYPVERRERRVVSVLFADLVGYTSRSEQLDVEDVDNVLAPYHRLLTETVEATGGVVAKLMGDGVMALFGAVAAHEDDPERALRCALAIRDALAHDSARQELRVRIGITTGEALVVRAAAGSVDAVGDVVNTAARLEVAAPVDGVLVDERTHRATSSSIRFRVAPPVRAKGKAAPVAAWLALDVASALPERAPAIDVALVGRSEELGVLMDLLDGCIVRSSTALVTVVGVPGIGKSRLVRELERLTDNRNIRWRHGRSPAYGEGIAFWALGEMVKQEASIRDSDSARITSAKLRETVARVVGEDERGLVTRYLLPLVGLEGEAAVPSEGSRVEAFAAWRRFVEALASGRPTVLVFEDMHRADAGLRDFVEMLATRVGALPLLIVCTTRPEFLDERPRWGGGTDATLLPLEPLSESATERLVEELLDQASLPATVTRPLLTQAGGNPLYAQEYVRMLRDGSLLVQTRGQWRLTREPEAPPTHSMR